MAVFSDLGLDLFHLLKNYTKAWHHTTYSRKLQSIGNACIGKTGGENSPPDLSLTPPKAYFFLHIACFTASTLKKLYSLPQAKSTPTPAL